MATIRTLFLVASTLALGSSAVASAATTTDVGWPNANNSLEGTRYSPLAQITSANAAGLRRVCSHTLRESGAFQSAPVIANGTIYITTAHDTYALDATTCAERWRNRYVPTKPDIFPVNRGVALAGRLIIRGMTDAHLVALDATSGKVVWNSAGASAIPNAYLAAAPIAWNGLVFIGTAGGDAGVSGEMLAFESATGKRVWRFSTVANGSDPGSRSWGATKDHRGGGLWTSFTLDPATGEVFVPVSNPFPDFVARGRTGTNLYTNALVVLDAKTGKLKWYFQADPGDVHDWDFSAPPALYTVADGTAMVAMAGKSGYIYGIDRVTHKALFDVAGTTVTPNRHPSAQGTHICPGTLGGSEWSGPAYDSENHLLLTPMDDWCSTFKTYSAPITGHETFLTNYPRPDPRKSARGMLTAIDASTGKRAWSYRAPAPMIAGVVVTAGGVVFAGDMAGTLRAFDTHSGKVLASYTTPGSIAGGVVTYSVAGKQYVAATSGNTSRLTWGPGGEPTLVVYALKAD